MAALRFKEDRGFGGVTAEHTDAEGYTLKVEIEPNPRKGDYHMLVIVDGVPVGLKRKNALRLAEAIVEYLA